MKCYHCKSRDAVFSTDCLVVDFARKKTNMGFQARYDLTEKLNGAVKAGLCEDCIKKVVRGDKNKVSPKVAMPLFFGMAGGVFAAVMGFIGTRGDSHDPALGRLLLIGGIALILLLALLYGVLVLTAPGRAMKNPWKLMGYRLDNLYYQDERKKLVPVGDGYYKSSAEFNEINDHLLAESQKKLYKCVQDGTWKLLVAGAQEAE